MKFDDYVLGLGKVVSNLQSLELVLRIFLCEANNFPDDSTTSMQANHLTNWDSLGQLIDKYHAKLSAEETASHSIEGNLVSVRDSLAHGRLCGKEKLFPLTLYKFGKPDKDGNVPIEHVTPITAEWLDTNVKRVLGAIQNVHQCAKARGYKSFPAE
jgi:hypothetical protein